MTISMFFMILAIILFILCYGSSNDNYIIPKFYWLVFIVPIVYAIILLWLFFTKDYIFPWERNYYKEYKNLLKENETLLNKNKKLTIEFQKLEKLSLLWSEIKKHENTNVFSNLPLLKELYISDYTPEFAKKIPQTIKIYRDYNHLTSLKE